MFNTGNRVVYFRLCDNGGREEIPCTVVGTFYEPGDPVQAVDLRADDGRRFGGVDSQDCRPA